MLTAERLREILRYDPETGIATYLNGKLASKPRWLSGKAQYITVKIDGRPYTMGRLAVLYITGALPREEVDHKDRDKHNNRWANLREATHQQNCANTPPKKKGEPKGVIYLSGRDVYRAQISVGGITEVIGDYMCKADAADAYARRAKEIHGEFAYPVRWTPPPPDPDDGWRDNWRIVTPPSRRLAAMSRKASLRHYSIGGNP